MIQVGDHKHKVVGTIKFVGALITADESSMDEAEINFNSIDTKADNYMTKSKLKNTTVIGDSVLYNTKIISKSSQLLPCLLKRQIPCS
jgi:hypothetical protein